MKRLLCLILAAALAASGGCRKKPQADLALLSPHNKNIEQEFETGFRAWHRQAYGRDVRLEWRDVGGTTSATQFLVNTHARGGSSGIDVYFGGGAPDHRLLASKGILQAVTLPEETLANLPKAIGGVAQYDEQGRWYGAAVSCFGILYNAQLMRQAGLPEPRAWDDLARPAMFGKLSAADATQSGSARAAYEMIIQSEPSWPAGWGKLLRIFANCKRYTGGASEVVNDVANGDVLAGTAIDFYAYDQMASSGEALGFAIVRGTTAWTPDPVALLADAPHPEMGKRFIEFVLSPRGQALWCLPPGTPDGPARSPLYRQPVRQDVYEACKGKMLPPLVNPFELSGQFQLNEDIAGIRIGRILAPLMQAAALENREKLAAAWKAMIAAGATQPAAGGAEAGAATTLMAQFVALPPELATEAALRETAQKLSDPRQAELLTTSWTRFFAEKYDRIAGK